MLLIDDIVLGPAKFVFWVLRQVHEAAREELAAEAEQITAELSRLHWMLERGEIAEAEFDEREKVLLERLETVEREIDGGSESWLETEHR